MKQALSPETPARVRRGQFRAITLGIGASAFAMACSFGAIDDNGKGNFPSVDPPAAGDPTTPTTSSGNPVTTPTTNGSPTTPTTNGTIPAAQPYNPDGDLFASEIGQQVKGILNANCAQCHQGAAPAYGDISYMLDAKALIDNQKIIPGNKEDSRIYSRMIGGQMPPAYIRDQRPTFGQIDIVGQWIDEMQPLASEICTPNTFVDNDKLITEMNNDVNGFANPQDAAFTRYITVAYNSNSGGCGRELDRQRYALLKVINSVSLNSAVTQLQTIDPDKLIYRVDIRDFNWDRTIDLKGDGTVTFKDGWDAIVNGVGAYGVEYIGTQADSLKKATGTTVPFIPANAFIQFADQGDLYYSLIGGKASLFDFEKQVLNIDTAQEILDNNVMRGGFTSSGVSKQDRVLNRFDLTQSNGAYWISFDFDGGGGAGSNHVANESIFADPLGFKFAGGEIIFNLPNGLQAYYVAKADGTRLNDAPIGVVVDPSQNNGNVVNGASCNSCHNAGMISFQDQVRQYVTDNATLYNNQVYQDVMSDYPDFTTFQAAMDKDSLMHTSALIKAGVPAKTPDPVSRVFTDFQLGNMTLNYVAGELGVTQAVFLNNLQRLDPSLQQVSAKGGYVDRNAFTAQYLAALCALQSVNQNTPANCP